MKLAKIYSALVAICFLASLCPAQNTPPPPPGMSKEEGKKWTKQQKNKEEKNKEESKKWTKQQKNEEKIQENARKKKEMEPDLPEAVTPATLPVDMTAKPEDVALFFKDYVGKTIKFEAVGIFELEAVRGTNEEMYGIDVSSKESYSKYVSPINKLNFIMTEQLAREVTAEQAHFLEIFYNGKIRRNVNIFAEMRRGKDDSKIAYILCMEFISKGIGITKKVGSCQ